MSDDSTSSWGMRGLRKWLGTAPETRDELLKLVQQSLRFLEPDTVAMLEGVLDLSATKIKEVMTPRPAMISLQENDVLFDVLDVLVDSAHSRFPVFSEQQPDTVVGILLAKDLLPFILQPEKRLNLKDILRQPVFVPENARTDQVLRMLKNTQTHIAIVVDEYGSTAGLVTLEDILEEIVGEIEDEHDTVDEETAWIVADEQHHGAWLVQALTPIEHFNEQMNTRFPDEEVETMGGLLLQEMGLVNELQGQVIEVDGWSFSIVEADARTIQLIRAVRL